MLSTIFFILRERKKTGKPKVPLVFSGERLCWSIILWYYLLYQGDHLIIANLGDSRAVLATTSEHGVLLPVQLTVDFKPNLPSELSVFLCWLPLKACSCQPAIDPVFVWHRGSRANKAIRRKGLQFTGWTWCVPDMEPKRRDSRIRSIKSLWRLLCEGMRADFRSWCDLQEDIQQRQIYYLGNGWGIHRISL